MINAWSLLHDELYGDEPMIETATNKDHNDFWENDGISMVGNPFPSAMSDDTITFSSTTFGAAQSVPYENFMGAGEDHISFDTGKFNLSVPAEKNNSMYKYNEEEILKELKDYIVRTYSMPAKYGSVAKAYIDQDEQLNQSGYTKSNTTEDKNDKQKPVDSDDGRTNQLGTSYIPNPLALNLYTLGYDANKKESF